MIDLRSDWRGGLIPLLAGMLLAGGAGAATHAIVERDEGVTRLVLPEVPRHVDGAELRALVRRHDAGGLATVDLAALRADIEAIDWVASAGVRRSWPDGLVVRIREHRPVARMGGGRYLTAAGRVVTLEAVASAEALPLLGVDEAHAANAFDALTALRDGLSATALAPAEIRRDARGSWTLVDTAGVSFRLGKGDPVTQLPRLRDAVAPALGGRLERVAYVDLRYGNGFAVGWDDTGPEME
ncbi:cell division protein FtsQ/DivIB [Algiphilus sp.]|uniref:cell division protein FtsQ/DivIB n=1 Tax=Algiphilus sp. TaxID=1872431 RepID=UPI0025BBF22A|nr:cell division protein FtsQ/DivIB [Algiphilus sp.]MCK5768992.1 FtsQ-type POTRA domain-containing protein [Algiphilus sp.]